MHHVLAWCLAARLRFQHIKANHAFLIFHRHNNWHLKHDVLRGRKLDPFFHLNIGDILTPLTDHINNDQEDDECHHAQDSYQYEVLKSSALRN